MYRVQDDIISNYNNNQDELEDVPQNNYKSTCYSLKLSSTYLCNYQRYYSHFPCEFRVNFHICLSLSNHLKVEEAVT